MWIRTGNFSIPPQWFSTSGWTDSPQCVSWLPGSERPNGAVGRDFLTFVTTPQRWELWLSGLQGAAFIKWRCGTKVSLRFLPAVKTKVLQFCGINLKIVIGEKTSSLPVIKPFIIWLCMLNHSVVSNSLQPHGVAHQAPLSMGFFRQGCWSGLPFSFSRGSSRPRGSNLCFLCLLHCRQTLYLMSHQGSPIIWPGHWQKVIMISGPTFKKVLLHKM